MTSLRSDNSTSARDKTDISRLHVKAFVSKGQLVRVIVIQFLTTYHFFEHFGEPFLVNLREDIIVKGLENSKGIRLTFPVSAFRWQTIQ